ncbi:MAG: transporter substrate-binding domain-containing protein [Burkholderiaceae bacterium]
MHAIGRLMATLGVVVLSSCASMPGGEQTRQSLAPSGQLRVAFLAGPLYATKDPGTGEFKGVAVDLGRSLAGHIGVPMQTVVYPNPTAIVDGAKAGEWDVAFMGMNAERAAAVDFTAPYMEVEQGLLVRGGVSITTATEVDKPGVRVGVLDKAGADVLLSRTLKNATLVRVKGTGDLEALLASGNAEVIAATKTFLYGRLASQPGARLLDDRILVEPIAMAAPKGRDPTAVAALSRFVEDAKGSGQVKEAIDRAGLRGVVVAPVK